MTAATLAGANPYVGLRPFERDDSLYYFGRREQTSQLLEQLHSNRFLAVVGSSGCGKSSLIMRTFPLYVLTFPSDEWQYVVIIKNNMTQARKALKNITNEFINNPMINARLLKILKNTSDIFEVRLDCGKVGLW